MRNVARTERSGVLLRLALAVAAMELMCQAVAVEAGLGAIDDDDQMNAGGGVIAGHAHAVHDDGGARALHDALSSQKDREAAMPDNWEADLDDILNKDGPFNPHHLSSLLRIKKIREQVSHSHELQGLAFGDMIVAGVAADRMLYCYTPDHFPQNMEPAFMTHDGLPPPDVGSVEDVTVFAGRTVEDALSFAFERCSHLEGCSTVGIDAHPHCRVPRESGNYEHVNDAAEHAGGPTDAHSEHPYALLHITYCMHDLHDHGNELVESMGNMFQGMHEMEAEELSLALGDEEHDTAASICEAAGRPSWDVWQPLVFELCGSESVPCRPPHDMCHFSEADTPVPWRVTPRGWSGHQCIRHLVSAHRHSEADAVGDADSQASDVEPLEELLDRAIATGIIPDVILEFGPHTADLRVTYVSQDNNPTRVFIGTEVSPGEARRPPTLSWLAEEDRYYAVLLVDPDAPSREDPRMGEWLHWSVMNLRAPSRGHFSSATWRRMLAKADTVVDYVGAAPPQGTGSHRYVMLLFEQPRKFDMRHAKFIDRSTATGRALFSNQAHAETYNLGPPVGLAMFVAEWDSMVREIQAQLRK